MDGFTAFLTSPPPNQHSAESLRGAWMLLESPLLNARRGGRLLVTTPNYRSFWPVMEWAVDRLNMAPKMAGEQHISRFHPASLRRLLVDCGLGLEYSGTIYNFSPFISLLSLLAAERTLVREIEHPSPLGMILVAVAIKN